MAKSKKQPPRQISKEELEAFFNATKDDVVEKKEVVQKISAKQTKQEKDIAEIGCSLVRMGTKMVKVVEWDTRNESVVVIVDGEPSRYKYPLHKNIYHRFVDFEVIEDCGYLEKFANGEEYVIDEKRYGVIGDVVWAGTKRYLSAKERVNFGSFRDFLAKQSDYSTKKAII